MDGPSLRSEEEGRGEGPILRRCWQSLGTSMLVLGKHPPLTSILSPK